MSFPRDNVRQFEMKDPKTPFYIFLGIIALFIISQSYVIIDPGYAGVSVTLGKASDHYLPEGLNFKIPLIQQVYKIPTKQITVQGIAECYSSDLQTVNVNFKALYRLPKERVVQLFTEIKGDPYEALVEPRIQDALKQVTAKYRAEDLVKHRESVKKEALRIINTTLKLALGTDTSEMTQDEMDTLSKKSLTPWVYLEDLPINNIELTEQLEHAIELKQIKEQEALAKEYELKKATKQAEITVVTAQADAQALRIKSAAIQSAPRILDLEMKKLDLEMTEKVLQKWNGVSPSTVVAGDTTSNVLLPLH